MAARPSWSGVRMKGRRSVQEILTEIEALTPSERDELVRRLAVGPEPLRGAPARAATPAKANGWQADFVVVFDGGSRGNPGPGYGSYLLIRQYDNARRLKRLRFRDQMTSNEAEYETLIAALVELLKWLDQSDAAAERSTVEIRGDSQLVISQVSGAWKGRSDRMRIRRDETRRLLSTFGGYRLVHQPREDSVALLGH